LSFHYNPPTTKKRIYIDIFHKHFPQVSAAQTVRKWIPRWQKMNPSGRANAAHIDAASEMAKAVAKV
jgi:asparagine synthase (glutamine-hydrolysing)